MFKHLNFLFLILMVWPLTTFSNEHYCSWQVRQDGVLFFVDKPLCGLEGDAKRGREVVINRKLGNCLACHVLPIEEESFHGEIGPPLIGVADRYSVAELRMRVIDEKQVNPDTIMPGFYRHPDQIIRLADSYFGKTFLTAQQVEDVVAYLQTLREPR